jgi:hypothetical protein
MIGAHINCKNGGISFPWTQSYIFFSCRFSSLNSVDWASRIISIMTFNIKTAREQFPALKQPQVFFDNAGGSQTLGTVIDS